MGIFQNLLGGGAEKLAKVADPFFHTNQEKAEMEFKKMQVQAEINRQEAQHRSIWVAGWRPFIGWVCGAGLAWSFILHPLLTWILKIFAPEVEPPPPVEVGTLITLLGGMLGMTAARTYEKKKKLTK